MNKHTTPPALKSCAVNTHLRNFSQYPRGNWNRHAKRRIPSRIRTVGRLARALRRADQWALHTVDSLYRNHPERSVLVARLASANAHNAKYFKDWRSEVLTDEQLRDMELDIALDSMLEAETLDD